MGGGGIKNVYFIANALYLVKVGREHVYFGMEGFRKKVIFQFAVPSSPLNNAVGKQESAIIFFKYG